MGGKNYKKMKKKLTEIIDWLIYITLIQMNTQDVFEIGIQQKKDVCIPCLF